MRNVGIVIPCLNEEKRLDVSQLTHFLTKNKEIHFCFINDGSTDGTQALLEPFNTFENAEVIKLDLNQGKAEAVRTGINHLKGHFSFYGFWDADLSTSLGYIDKMLSELSDEHHLVIGCRSNSLSRSRLKKFLNSTLQLFCKVLFNWSLGDTQCGAKLFKPEVLRTFEKPFISRWLFDIEIFIRFFQSGYLEKNVFSFPIVDWNEVKGSKLGLIDYLKSGSDLLKIALHYRFR